MTHEEVEREAIQFSDTDEGRDVAERVGNEFLEMALADMPTNVGIPNACHTQVWNWIGSQDSLADLLALERLFDAMLTNKGANSALATEIRELVTNRRALLTDAERHNKKTNEQDASTDCPL